MRIVLLFGFAMLLSGCAASSGGQICQTDGYQMGSNVSYQCLDDQQASPSDIAEVLPPINPYRVNGAQ